MPNYREVISDIISDLKSVNLDDAYSFKHIAHKLQDAAQTFLKTDSEYRTVLKTFNLFTPIDCFELIEIPITECGCDVSCVKKVMKSKIKLPETYESKYGNLLKVLTINLEHEYTKIEPFTYKDYKSRKYGKSLYFWILDDYIYIPDSEVEAVYVLGAFKNLNDVLAINSKSEVCFSILDSDFNFPDYITSLAKEKVLSELGNLKSINEDNKPNLNSGDR